MAVRWIKRYLAWVGVLAMLLSTVVGSLPVLAAGGKAPEEWVIYRPGTNTALTSTTANVTVTETGTTFSIPGNGELNFYRSNMNLQIPPTLKMSDLALHIRIYVENIAMLDVGQIELSNKGNDDYEVAWLLESIRFVPGWNDLVLPFDTVTTYSGNEFDLYSPIRWFRMYSETKPAEPCTVKVEDVTITLTESGMTFGQSDSYIELSKPLPQTPSTIEASIKMDELATEWVISNCDGKDGLYNTYETATLTPSVREDGTPYMRINIEKGGKASIRCKGLGIVIPKAFKREDLAFSFQVYIDNIENLPSGELEITSDTNDSMEIHWKVARLNWHSGWNEVLLPFTSAHGESDNPFNPNFINYFRWTFSSVVPEDMELGLAQLKIVALVEETIEEPETEEGTLWRISHCAGKDSLTDTGGSAVSFETEDGMPYLKVLPNNTRLNVQKEKIGLYIPPVYELSNLALSMKVYVSHPERLERWRLELASTGQDKDEIQWIENQYQWQQGWNDLYLTLDSFDAETGQFNPMSINWFRFYSSFDLPAGTEIRVANIKIVPIQEMDVKGSKWEQGPETHMIFSNTNSGDEQPIALLITRDGHPSVVWGDLQVTFDYYVFTGQWIHLAVVRDMTQNAFILYVNGEEKDRADATGTRQILPTTRHCIGSDGAGVNGGIFHGKLGDVRVWSTIRTPQEIADNIVDMTRSRSNGFGENTKGLIGSWFLNEDLNYVFNTVQDVSKFQNTGIIKGTRASDWVDYQNPLEGEDYYTIVVLPDIQELTAKYRNLWFDVAAWIRDNVEKENIQHVISVGDSTYNNNDVEWAAARAGYDMFGSKVTYTNIPGNHDYGDWSKPVRDTTMFNQYFSYRDARFNNPTFVESYKQGEMENAYYTFEVNGIPYLVLALEFRPRDSVLEWANRVLDNYPNHNVIVTIHGYLNNKGQIMTDEIEGHEDEYIFTLSEEDPHNNGLGVWEKVIATHDNVRLVLCGHKHSENVVLRTDRTNNGTTVYQMLFNAQDLDRTYFNGTGLGMLGLLRFSADGTRMAVNYYAPKYDKSFRSVNQFVLDMDVITTEYEQEPEVVPPSVPCEHSDIDWLVKQPAGCTEEGLKVYACTTCGKVYDSMAIPATGHTPGEWEIVEEPTCTEQGQQVKRCTSCDEVLDTETIPPTGHSFGEWIVDKQPTYTEEGERRRICSVCGHEETQTLPKLSREKGDANGDGKITITDARLALQIAAGQIPTDPDLLLDMDGDGQVTASDARLILQYAVGKIQDF